MKFYPKLFLFICMTLLGLTLFSCELKKHESKLQHINGSDTTIVLKTICFGACNRQWEDQSYWQTIEKEKPDLWIWMGDIIYCDTDHMSLMRSQYDLQKSNLEYMAFIDSVRVIGIWDDHDFGKNDGGTSFLAKKGSRDLLFDFLDIPESDPIWKREGAYQSYVFGPDSQQVKVFLLDGRYFRDDLLPDDNSDQRYLQNKDGTYLGDKQWQWLENELKNNQAKINIFVSGIQFIPTEHYFEKWYNFPIEREKFMNLISSNSVQNPMILSGDRHIGEISKTIVNGMELFEVTSSGLTHSYEKADEENPYRVGELISVRNFGKLDMKWEMDSLSIRYAIHDLNGNTLESVQSTVKLKD
jgi:alkaline phosphatase D